MEHVQSQPAGHLEEQRGGLVLVAAAGSQHLQALLPGEAQRHEPPHLALIPCACSTINGHSSLINDPFSHSSRKNGLLHTAPRTQVTYSLRLQESQATGILTGGVDQTCAAIMLGFDEGKASCTLRNCHKHLLWSCHPSPDAVPASAAAGASRLGGAACAGGAVVAGVLVMVCPGADAARAAAAAPAAAAARDVPAAALPLPPAIPGAAEPRALHEAGNAHNTLKHPDVELQPVH